MIVGARWDGSRSEPNGRPRGMGRPYDPHEGMMWERGEGVYLWASDGRRYLDCISGYSANNLGHAHPELVRVVSEQAARGAHFPGGESQIRRQLESVLTERTQEQLPDAHAHALGSELGVWLSTTGARAIEVAWKIAFASRSGGVVRFDLGYHGRSLGASLLSDTRRSGLVENWTTDESIAVRAIPFPRRSDGQSLENACEGSLQIFARLLDREAHRLSMLLIEPAIGARGYYFAPSWYYRRLVEMARNAGLLVISDEIQMGLGRIAAWSGATAAGWLPDMWVFGKSLGGGLMPISAVIGTKRCLDAMEPHLESETFAGHPFSCAIACQVLGLLRESDLASRSERLHEGLRRGLVKFLPVGSVVGSGSASAIDFAALDSSRAAADGARRFVIAARDLGALLHLTGPDRDRVAIIPPLVVSESEMDEIQKILRAAWEAI